MADLSAEERAARAIMRHDPLGNTLIIQRAVTEEIHAAEQAAAAQARAEEREAISSDVAANIAGVVGSAILAEREACAWLAAEWAQKNSVEANNQRRKANRLGDDPFGHGDQALAAADVLSETAHECAALAAAIRARSTD